MFRRFRPNSGIWFCSLVNLMFTLLVLQGMKAVNMSSDAFYVEQCAMVQRF